MTKTAARVVALWGLVNAVLVATLIGFGEWIPVLAMAASMVGLVFVIAGVVRIGERREEGRSRWPQAPNGDSVLLFAAGVVVIGIGLAYYPYLALLAIVPFTAAALSEISSRRTGIRG